METVVIPTMVKETKKRVKKVVNTVVDNTDIVNTKVVVDDVEEDKPKKEKKLNLPAKYNKFMVFGFWFIENLAKDNTDFDKQAALSKLTLFSSVEDQIASFKQFLEQDFKPSQKLMKSVVRLHNKKPKTPKTTKTVSDTDAPPKKRGRKAKTVQPDSNNEHADLIHNLVHAANNQTPEDNNSRDTTTDIDNNKQPKKNTKKNTKKEPKTKTKKDTTVVSQSLPVPVPIVEHTTVVSKEDSDDSDDSDEEELDVSHFEFNGKQFLIDADMNLYDVLSFQQLGKFIDNNIVFN